jgi:methylmalonyl-CoA/ethylmalonyl-CoA epimerase
LLRGLDHIGIAVHRLDEAIPALVKVLGLRHVSTEEVPDQGVRVAALEGGGQTIELLEKTAESSPIARFLERKGPGVHHVAYEVEDLEGTLRSLKAAGVRLIDESPRPGAFGKRIAFLHPGATGGVLIELCEVGRKESST